MLKVYTAENGIILDATPQAAELLNLSARGVRGRPFSLFFTGERDQVRRALTEAVQGHTTAFDAWIRPRDRKPVPVYVSAGIENGDTRTVRWIITVDQRGAPGT